MAEGKSAWDVFAQKYIGSVSECYRMSLKTLCALTPSELHGDERYAACMQGLFSSICPSASPFPCLDGCNKSYQQCRHLAPPKIVPGWFAATSTHVASNKQRFAQFLPPPKAPTPADGTTNTDGGGAATRFGSPDLLLYQRAVAERRRALASKPEHAQAAKPPSPSKKKRSPSLAPSHADEAAADLLVSKQRKPEGSEYEGTKADGDAGGGGAAADTAGGLRISSDGSLDDDGEAADGATALSPPPTPLSQPRRNQVGEQTPTLHWGSDDQGDGDAERGLSELLALRGLTHEVDGVMTDGRAMRLDELRGGGDATREPRVKLRWLTLLQIPLILYIACALGQRSGHGRRLLRSIGAGLYHRVMMRGGAFGSQGGRTSTRGPGGGRPGQGGASASAGGRGARSGGSGARHRGGGGGDSRLLGEI